MIFIIFGCFYLLLYFLVSFIKGKVTIKRLFDYAKEEKYSFLNYLVVLMIVCLIVYFSSLAIIFIVDFGKFVFNLYTN